MPENSNKKHTRWLTNRQWLQMCSMDLNPLLCHPREGQILVLRGPPPQSWIEHSAQIMMGGREQPRYKRHSPFHHFFFRF